MRVLAHLVLALLLAGLVGVGVHAGAQRWREQQVADNPELATPQPLDRVTHALAGLRDDGVYVAPDGRAMLDAAGERKVARAIREAALPVRVVVWAPTSDAGASDLDVKDQFREAYADERGVVIIWEGPQEGQLFTTGQDGWVNDFDTDDFAGEPEVALVEAVTKAQDVYWRTGSANTGDTWGGTGGAIAAGILFGLGGLLVFLLALGLARAMSKGRLRLPGGWL